MSLTKAVAVIMAGGKGERLWPLSRAHYPKQFLSVTDDDKTMIQKTVDRISSYINYEDIFIVTNHDHADIVRKQLPLIHDDNLLIEPMGKNTAACIGFAAAVISSRYNEAVMVVIPSDHMIFNEHKYIETINHAVEFAKNNEALITIGMTPDHPETGYGYIKYKNDMDDDHGICKVIAFVEKPDSETAEKYLSSGEYLWNSGIFVFKTSDIINSFLKFLPDVYNCINDIRNAYGSAFYHQVVHDCFDRLEPVSIDIGIMEKESKLYVLKGDFGWDDIGNFKALSRINEIDSDGNYTKGEVVSVSTADSIISTRKRLIAAVGLKDLIIIDTDDVLLICHKDSTHEIKKALEHLRENSMKEYL